MPYKQDALHLTQKWSKLQQLWHMSLSGAGIEAISEALGFLESSASQSQESRRDSCIAAGASRSNSGSWEVTALSHNMRPNTPLNLLLSINSKQKRQISELETHSSSLLSQLSKKRKQ
ncbi:hypothetical protein Ciccas_010938, partial [Cichlidogyrus casuarinus]